LPAEHLGSSRSDNPRSALGFLWFRLSRIYSVQGRAGVSPAPLGRQSARPNSKIPADHFLVMPADNRSIERNQLPCWAGGTPALLSTAYFRPSRLEGSAAAPAGVRRALAPNLGVAVSN